MDSFISYLLVLQFHFWGIFRITLLLFLSFKILFIYLLAALGLHYCVQAFSSCAERGLLFIAVRGLLIAVDSLAAEHGL